MEAALGTHMILDIWGAVKSYPFKDMDGASAALKNAAEYSGATVITERWHHFGENCGYTGVIILAESHISVHTWPERGYAAVDVFMCGDKAEPSKALQKILDFYKYVDYTINMIARGTER